MLIISWADYRKLFIVACVLLIEAGQLALGQTSCLNSGNYTRNSIYAVNLNNTFTILSTNLRDSGFYNASVGEGEDRANAIVLCRGDAQLETCRKCIQESADELLRSCPSRKQAIRWDGGRCVLRYSNATIYGVLALVPGRSLVNSFNITGTTVEQFMTDLRRLLYGLHGQATSGGSLRKVAAQNSTLPNSSTIYAMVQCTPDLSPQDCSNCLNYGYEMIPRVCGARRGCRILLPSCTVRYQIYLFYNQTTLQELDRLSLSPSPSLPPENGDGNTTKTVIIIVVPTVLGLVLAVSVIIWLRRNRKTQNPTEYYQRTDDEIVTAESLQYPFSTIKTATNDFSDDNKLGEGGFGSVYEGELPNGQEIAVKRLSMNSGQGVVEFKNEVVLLAKLQHRNLVRLLGFAIQGMEKLLIYELVQNASLDHFIFDERRRSYLDWDKRHKIIGGTARGILYLHEDSRLKIIHRDLKPSNILLDREMNPKIADFGMARLFGQDETQGNTSRVVGTYGYMPPEYLLHGQFSTKSDVFSFGVLVLEIISGRRNNNFRSGDSVEDLLSFAWKNWREGRATNVVDPSLRSGSMSEMARCIHIGLLCVQENAAERPTMAAVVIMLSSYSINLALPFAPAFYLPATSDVDDHNSTSVSADQLESYNEVSITDFYPR